MVTIENNGWSLPGARWWKFDFHTHTPESIDYGKGPQSETLRQTEPTEWLLQFMRAGVDCVAITDHNSGEWIDRLRTALAELEKDKHPEFQPLHLFPGVEITANGGTHILALFDPTTSSGEIAVLLGAVRYRGESGKSDVAAESAPIQVVEAIHKAGAIPILAHVDEPDGAWKMPGNTLAPLLDGGFPLAIEVRHPQRLAPELYRQRKLEWAEVLGSDSHHPKYANVDRFPGSHFTWVKMSAPSIEGLRLALLDGRGFSIRRSDSGAPFDPLAFPKHYIQTIELANARYMGNGTPAKLEFSPWLNALIGGRGTGKSTVIHGLRLVTRRNDELVGLEEHSVPRLTFERFGKVPQDQNSEGGLRENTEILWTVMRDGVRHRLRWRQNGTDWSVEEQSDDGTWSASESQNITGERFPVRLFSQGQIADMAGDNQLPLLQVINDAAGATGLKDDVELARRAFYATRAQIRDLDIRLKREETLSVELQDVERKLRVFEGSGYAAILTSYRHRGRQETEVDKRFGSLDESVQRIDETATGLTLEDWPEGLFDTNSGQDADVINAFTQLEQAVSTAADALRRAAELLREETRAKREELASSSWKQAVESAGTDYADLIKKLEQDGISDLNEYAPLVQERERLERESVSLRSERELRDELVNKAEGEVRAVAKARRAISDAREAFLSANLAQNRFVRMELRPYGDDLRAVERSLREALDVLDDRFQDDILRMEGTGQPKGIVSDLLVGLPDDAKERYLEVEARLDTLKGRLALACAGGNAFGGRFNNYLQRNASQSPDFLDRLKTWFPEDALDVRYSRTGDGKDFQPIAQASAGQRAAAMLAFLLAHGEEPLILDQPEDDLDNQLIYDLVVQQIRENKLRRQIIVVTHNPNIVVNGDAELLHALEFQSGQCVVAQSGSLQEKAMRDKVCQVMEGGREAFERRYRRLGPEIGNIK